MNKSLPTVGSTQRRRFLWLAMTVLGGALTWRRVFWWKHRVRSDRHREKAQNVVVTINPLAVSRNTTPTRDNG